MRLGTHLTGGVLAYTVAATFFHLPWTPSGLVAASAAAAAPDVDTLGSTVGRVFAPLARRIERRWGHRTITHCYAAQLAVAALALPLLWSGLPGGPLPHIYAAVVVGYASHCLLDTWTVQGVRVFWPWSDRRGVFPYYNRQETAYRTVTGSRMDSAFGVAFLCLTVPFAVVQVDGYQRLVRRVQADAGAAVRDFLDWSADGYLVSVDVEASDPQHLRRLDGRFEAIGTTDASTLLVRDSTSGTVYSLGPAYAATFQPDRVVAHRGPHVALSRRQVDMAGRILADLADVVPTSAGGAPVRHLLDGQVTLTEPAGVTPDDSRFNTLVGADRHLALSFATLADLDRLGVAGLMVETGTVTVRVYPQTGEAEGYRPGTAGGGLVRRIAVAHHPADAPRLRVAEGDAVAVGDTVAVLSSAVLIAARLDADLAADDLAAAQATPLPASADAPALEARLAAALADAQRVEARHTAGFESAAAVAAARAVADGLRQQSAQADARQADARRSLADRVRQAAARLARARLRLATATAGSVVLSTAAGTVRQIEHRSLAPDRAEVRLVLVAPRAARPAAARPAAARPAAAGTLPLSTSPPRR